VERAVGAVRQAVVRVAVRPAAELQVAVRQPAVVLRPAVVPLLVVRPQPERRAARSGSLSWPG
jgi:hypothetical protein